MLSIDQVLISDDVIEEKFVCDLSRCKGGCCVDGDAGAPLSREEAGLLEEIAGKVIPYLPEASVRELRRQGAFVTDAEGYMTPLVDGGICVYGIVENGIVKCGIEKAFQDGKISFKKPLSCHLYPIRIQSLEGYEAMNYEPREDLCKPGCALGAQLRVPVFRFLKEALVRRYGEAFYEALEAYAAEVSRKAGTP